MNIAVVYRVNEALSIRLYRDHVVRELSSRGVECMYCDEGSTVVPECDIIWEPGACMRRVPRFMHTSERPTMVTFHGAKAFSCSLNDMTVSSEDAMALAELKDRVADDWALLRRTVVKVVAVSEFAANEAREAFALPADMVHVVPHGVDHQVFGSGGDNVQAEQPYLVHVSRLDPLKNHRRLFKAYSLLDKRTRPTMVAIVLPDEDQMSLVPEFTEMCGELGIRWIGEELPQQELARWYRGAVALVLPSLRETFGLPIIEAMASGCPVITSNSTGCAEVAGDAALLVDPRSVDDIAAAMRRVVSQPALAEAMRRKGLERAKSFTWGRSADETLRVMQAVLPPGEEAVPQGGMVQP